MKRRIILIMIAMVSLACTKPHPNPLATLDLESTREHGFTVWYSTGHEKAAVELNELLGASKTYFNEHLNINQDYDIAMLNSDDWQAVSKVPYGLPFVSGPPYVIGIPATTNHPLGETLKTAFAHHDAPPQGMSIDDQTRLFISIIGFHELGHIYAKAAAIQFPYKWIDEFTATYLAYSYLAAERPQFAALWRRGSQALIETIQPAKTGLAEFESLYYRVGIENYAWYQAVFLMQVESVHARHQIAFIKALRKQPLPVALSQFSLEALERQYPGFMEWAQDYALIE